MNATKEFTATVKKYIDEGLLGEAHKTYEDSLALVWMPEAMKRLDEVAALVGAYDALKTRMEAIDTAAGMLKLALIASPNNFGATNGDALMAILELDKARLL